MKKIVKRDSQLYRILETKGEMVLVIDCVKRTMPSWISESEIKDFVDCTEDELYPMTGMEINRELNGEERRTAQERFTMIAGVLPFIGDMKMRKYMIQELSKNISKQTIRKYLCLYLVYQDISVLAPMKKEEQELTNDEKQMRWALNKFFYTEQKQSLKTAYTMMLKAKYCDANGILLAEYPSYYQFRYFYRKTKEMRKYYISRDGIKAYERNHRPLLGDGVQEFASSVGTAMLDSTVCDIYLVDDAGSVIGRPNLVVCVDAYSSMCLGYSLGWEAGIQSLRSLMLNVITDKVEWCESRGVFIDKNTWNCNQMPSALITDMGTEYAGSNFAQLAELGVKIVNLPPYRPELKGTVEKFFSLIQDLFKKQLKGKGVIEPDFQERGARDYRKDACLTLEQFEQVILHCILYYNNNRIIENFPYTQEMIKAGVKPYAKDIFEWGRNQLSANLIDIDAKTLIQTLLPRTTGKFGRKGLKVNSLRYKNKKYVEDYLNGREATVAYNPDDVSEVWLIEDGAYVAFELIETRFKGKNLEIVEDMQKSKKELVQDVQRENLQAQIDLAEHIQVIANQSKSSDVKLKDIRKTRTREQRKQHIDYTKAV